MPTTGQTSKTKPGPEAAPRKKPATKPLAELQAEMQAAILAGDDAILAAINDTSKETRATLLNVYQYAYGARLREFIGHDYPVTSTYMGDDHFEKAADGYHQAFPSDNPNARWFGRHYPEFLAITPPFNKIPELAELAGLENALNCAFDADDTPPVNAGTLTKINPEVWADLTFRPHPSAKRLAHKTNAAAIWKALSKEQEPPEVKLAQMPEELIVWREKEIARFRPMSYDEAMIWDEAVKGANFGALCEMLGTYWPSEDAPMKAAGYLQSWLSSDILAAAEIRVKSQQTPS